MGRAEIFRSAGGEYRLIATKLEQKVRTCIITCMSSQCIFRNSPRSLTSLHLLALIVFAMYHTMFCQLRTFRNLPPDSLERRDFILASKPFFAEVSEQIKNAQMAANIPMLEKQVM